MMKKLDEFFKRKSVTTTTPENDSHYEGRASKIGRTEAETTTDFVIGPFVEAEFDITKLERDPGKRRQISDYPSHLRDVVRRTYIKLGPYQPIVKYRKSTKNSRSFQASWYQSWPTWLEYSPKNHTAFCLPCFLFKKDGNSTSKAFTIVGFDTWNKVNGINCALSGHIGKRLNSSHREAEKACADLMNKGCHIANTLKKATTQEIVDNRLRLTTIIKAVRFLVIQGCALRGHDESDTSSNRGNFLELTGLMGECHDQIAAVLKNAPGNALYTSPKSQKEILHILANKVKKEIREKIGNGKYCLLVDEARDESKREQMSIVLRFVDKEGCIQESFFGLIHVTDTKASTLRDNIFMLLSQYDLDVKSIRGQGYDGASNMRGEFKGLKALVSKECPQAYFVHCFAHRLQLSLVASAHEVPNVSNFFRKLNFIIGVVGGSCKRNDQLKAAHASNVEFLLDIGELESGTGRNQIGSLVRAGDTRWSSHLKSIDSLLTMYSAACEVSMNIMNDKDAPTKRGDGATAYDDLVSIEFVFFLHIMQLLLGISDKLCQALQLRTQDILNAIRLVSTTKKLIQKERDSGWEKLVEDVRQFCEKVSLDFPDFSATYIPKKGRHYVRSITVEEYYRAEFFYEAVDSQLSEMNYRFNDNTVELMRLSSALDPYEMVMAIRIDDICELAEKFYKPDFNESELRDLRRDLAHIDYIREDSDFKELKTLSDLSQWMVKTKVAATFPLVHRVVSLILLLPVSTATTERSFSAMKIIKNTRRNRMEDEFLSDSLSVYIEREISMKFSADSIIDDFRDMAERRCLF